LPLVQIKPSTSISHGSNPVVQGSETCHVLTILVNKTKEETNMIYIQSMHFGSGEKLLTWSYTGDVLCRFCRSCVECQKRLFFDCGFSKRVSLQKEKKKKKTVVNGACSPISDVKRFTLFNKHRLVNDAI
jgi:hypothetical protein